MTAPAEVRSRVLALVVTLLPAAHVFVTSTMAPSVYGFDGYPVYDAKRLLQLLILPLMFAIMLADGGLRNALSVQIRQVPTLLGIAILGFFGLGVLSAFVNAGSTAGLAYSLSDVGLLAMVVAAVPCIAACRDVANPAFDKVLCGFLILVPLVVGIQELLGVFAVRSAGLEFGFYISLPNFHFPRFYNQMQSWMIPATVAAVLVFPGNRLARWLIVCALTLHWYVVLATGARGTMVGVGLGIAACALVFPRIRWLQVRYQSVGILVGLAIFLALSSAAPVKPEVANETGDLPAAPPSFHGDSLTGALSGERMLQSSGRTAMWRDSLRDAQGNPILGIGPGNFACGGWITRGAHPHSFPMQILGEWGVPVFVVLIGIAGFLAVGAVKCARSSTTSAETARLGGVLACAVLAAAIHACLSGVYLMPASQLTGVIAGGWLVSLLHRDSPTIPRPKAATGIAFASVALVLALILASWSWYDYENREAANGHLPQWDQALPRFWHNGKICPAT